MIKDFIDLKDFSSEQIQSLLDRAIGDKQLLRSGKLPATLQNRTLAMIFEKPSLRTRVSFETGMTQLGGHAIYLTQSDIGLGSREPVQDVARVLAGMCDGIMARTFNHQTVLDLARFSSAPVINALTDYSHPCQAMADMMTAIEYFRGLGEDGCLTGKTLMFVGDGNNVARSLATACAKLDMTFILAAPQGYELEQSFVDSLGQNARYELIHDPQQAADKTDIFYADTWVSMGQEDEKLRRIKAFKDFQINSDLLSAAKKHATVMHCLPAYRDYEITDDVMETHACTIFEEAENRLHFQRTLMSVLIAQGGIE